MYLASALGFYLFAAISHWSKYEQNNLDIGILKDFLANSPVHIAFALLFGCFGPLLNVDAARSLGAESSSFFFGVPDVMPMLRCLVVGLGGPLAASKLFQLASDKRPQRADGSTQVDDIVRHDVDRKTFWQSTKELFLIQSQ
jgi:hypothetical protein